MRKITEKDIKGWFPADNRFLHYCAKFYGYSFYNDDVVAEAAFQAARAITKMYNEQREFDNEEHMVGMVMSSFRFAILNAYTIKKRSEKLEVRPMTDYEYSEGSDSFNMVMDRKTDNTKPYDNTNDFLKEVIAANLPPVERDCIVLHFIDGLTGPDISCELDITYNEYRAAIQRGLRKLKRAFKNEQKKPKVQAKPRNIQPTKRALQPIVQCQPFTTNKAERSSHSKAMSFLHTDE